MITERLAGSDVLLLKPQIFRDSRGQFLETWQDERYALAGVSGPFVQDNTSVSVRDTLRGLHYQHPHGQGKLISALQGRIHDIAVDIRRGSPNMGRWVGIELSSENGWQLYVPPGFAHGFAVLSDIAVVSYKCTDVYLPACEHSLLWNDPALGITWPLAAPILSDKDAGAPGLAAIPLDHLPTYVAPHG